MIVSSKPVQLLTSLVYFGLISAAAAQQPPPFLQPYENFAELFTSENGTLLYNVAPEGNVLENTINHDDRGGDKVALLVKPSGFFPHSRSTGNETYLEKGVPTTTPDAPYFAPHALLRLKRDAADGSDMIPAWQRAWRERYERYHSREASETTPDADSTTTTSTTTTTTTTRRRTTHARTTTTTPTTTTTTKAGRNKFARQFIANDQQDDGEQRGSGQIDDGPDSTPDDNTVVEPVDPVTTTQEPTTTTTHKRHKKPKHTTVTTPTTTTTTPTTTTTTTTPTTTTTTKTTPTTRTTRTTTTTEEIPDASVGGADDDSDGDDSGSPMSMVQNIISDLALKGASRAHDLPPPVDVRPLWMEPEPTHLDPRQSQMLRDMIVEKHNYLRSQVAPLAGNMLKMQWNDDAQKIAQRWAEVCRFEHDNGEQRTTPQFKCGQNLARGWPKPLSWNLTMQLWFDERKDFNFDGLPRGMVGHYTQLVWAQSYQIGCAYKDCGKFHFYVCDYCPTGNLDSKKYRPYQKAQESCESCPGNCANGKLCTNPCRYTDKYSNCPSLDQEFQVCTDMSYGLLDSCLATCKCQTEIH